MMKPGFEREQQHRYIIDYSRKRDCFSQPSVYVSGSKRHNLDAPSHPIPGMAIRRVLGPVLDSLRSFKGNARTCILVEPLWGISYNLFVPYAFLYMLALGVGVASPVVDDVLANSVEDSTRATALAIVYTLMYAITAPFGWIAGQIAAAGPRRPSLFAAITMAAAAGLPLFVDREHRS